MNRLLAYLNYLFIGDTRFLEKKGGGCERLRVPVIMICARCCSKIRRVFGSIMSSLREAFISRLRAGVMEQASGSFMTGIRAFAVHLPLTSLLWPSAALRFFVYFQVNTGVSYLLDYVEDTYDDGGPLCPRFNP